ncbi:OPT-domain-containing protein [Rhizoclosmatium globosum]|uniref:OPT-domain-containing protein n=1 Tax=Rhizoclosmatium globosum TaxID=329046 RepID=A0A1Y2C9U6_9FUNG|nr:OPT-domain-containing protein [Rhizoclosmatium globosum]|eukprot:ORY43799.1 OPT-domain-containing protein [Rhizoclosmatium globosum]
MLWELCFISRLESNCAIEFDATIRKHWIGHLENQKCGWFPAVGGMSACMGFVIAILHKDLDATMLNEMGSDDSLGLSFGITETKTILFSELLPPRVLSILYRVVLLINHVLFDVDGVKPNLQFWDEEFKFLLTKDLIRQKFGHDARPIAQTSFTARDFNSAYYEQFDPDEATKGQAPPDDMLGAYDTVQKFVPEFDTPSMPALTFRTSPTFDVTPFMVVIACYPIGIFMANTLPIRTFTLPRMPFSKSLYPPTFTLNPGPFSVKEHTLIFVFASTATVSSYGMGNIIAQKYILGMDIHDVWCFLFLLVSQFNGYGLTGLFRKFLVRPSSMLWPQCLTVVSFMNTFHEEVYGRHEPDGVTDKLNARLPNGPRLSRFAFFWTAGAVMFLWQFLPSFIAPFLSAVSVLCLFNVGNEKLKLMGSAAQGVGFLSVTFDWSIISSVGPINSPFWALVNNVVGSWIFLWVVTPLLWATNTFGSDSLLGADPVYGANGTGMFPLGSALNSYNLFDKDSNLLPIRSLLDPATNTTLDLAFYDSVKPVRMSTVFAVSYMSKFLCITATVVHVALWYGADIVHRFKTAARDLDTEDIHAKLMDVYAEVPDSWYWMLLFVNSVIGLSVCQWGGFALPWWGVLLSTTLALVLFLPLGIIRAISGQVFGINVLAEMVGGYMFPGQMISVLTYKSLTTMSLEQGMLLIQDLNLDTI